MVCALSLALAAVSPLVAGSVQPNLARPGPLEWWFFWPLVFTDLLSPSPDWKATVGMLVYALQYFAVLTVAAWVLGRTRRPRGVDAERAFDQAATRFHS
jgi:hypothetical protein